MAEAIQACAALGVPEGIHAQWLAESLGLLWKESVGGAEETQPPIPASQPPSTGSSKSDVSRTQEIRKLKLLDPVGHEPMAFEQIFEGHTEKIRSAVELKPASLADTQERPDFQPLFLDRWFQGIITVVLGVQVPSQEIDFRKLERCIVEGEFFAELPFKKRTKLFKGVHVLLDRSQSMLPFRRDQVELISRLRRLLGEALVRHSSFEYDATGSRLIWRTPKPRQFRMEMPVVVVTDFGCGLDLPDDQSMNWEPWLAILQLAQCSRSPIFALIPSAPDFWPVKLNRFANGSLLWDRETSPQAAARRCRR